MIDIETYLTIFKRGETINIDEVGNKSRIYSIRLTQDEKAKWLKNTKLYYIEKVELTIKSSKLNGFKSTITLDKVIEFNKDKMRDYKLGKLLDII